MCSIGMRHYLLWVWSRYLISVVLLGLTPIIFTSGSKKHYYVRKYQYRNEDVYEALPIGVVTVTEKVL